MCWIGGAQIIGTKALMPPQGANCNEIARAGGKIFDSCWRADGTVKGRETVAVNQQIQVNINGP